MIVCNKCGKDNQDHYKFCLGCGSELGAPVAAAVAPSGVAPSGAAPKKTAAPRPVVPDPIDPVGGTLSPTPPAGMAKAVEGPALAPDPVVAVITDGPASDAMSAPTSDEAFRATAPDAAAAPSARACPSCGTENPKEFAFCGSCGARIPATVPPKTLHLGSMKPAVERPLAQLALIRPDGTEGGTHTLEEVESLVGRSSGSLFTHDAYLSPTHARIHVEDGQIALEDMGSLNGVFIRISNEEFLRSGDIFRIGQELLRFDAIVEPQLMEDGTEIMGSPNPGYWGRLSVIMGPSVDGSAFPLMGDEMVLGRERGDILFSDDGYVSGTHARISVREDGYFLADLGSSNGTFVRLTEPRTVANGTYVLMGQQLFRIDLV